MQPVASLFSLTQAPRNSTKISNALNLGGDTIAANLGHGVRRFRLFPWKPKKEHLLRGLRAGDPV